MQKSKVRLKLRKGKKKLLFIQYSTNFPRFNCFQMPLVFEHFRFQWPKQNIDSSYQCYSRIAHFIYKQRTTWNTTILLLETTLEAYLIVVFLNFWLKNKPKSAGEPIQTTSGG